MRCASVVAGVTWQRRRVHFVRNVALCPGGLGNAVAPFDQASPMGLSSTIDPLVESRSGDAEGGMGFLRGAYRQTLGI